MKIVRIFEGRLYSVNETGEHELRRILRLWKDFNYVYHFLTDNKEDTPSEIKIEQLAESIIDNAFDMEEMIIKLARNENARLEEFFKPLNNYEYQIRKLAGQKGRKNYLRIYAIRIDDNCFLITGGAIKLTQFMEERNHTDIELKKIKKYRDYLVEEQVFDAVSFNDFLTEQL